MQREYRHVNVFLTCVWNFGYLCIISYLWWWIWIFLPGVNKSDRQSTEAVKRDIHIINSIAYIFFLHPCNVSEFYLDPFTFFLETMGGGNLQIANTSCCLLIIWSYELRIETGQSWLILWSLDHITHSRLYQQHWPCGTFLRTMNFSYPFHQLVFLSAWFVGVIILPCYCVLCQAYYWCH